MKNIRVSLLVVVALFVMAMGAQAQTASERIMESRFQIDLKVPDSALKSFLPDGWSPNVAAQGPAKDCNLRLIFIDQQTINGPDGKPLGKGSSLTAALIAPVKDPSGNNAQLVIGGITGDASGAPGPFGNYLAASTMSMRRTTSSSNSGATIESQDWVFHANSGEHLEMHIRFEKGVGNRSNPVDVKFYSAKDPTIVQVSHQQQVLDILKNVTTTPKDRVQEFKLKTSGGSYAKLFDGTEQVLSWDNILWIDRSILAP